MYVRMYYAIALSEFSVHPLYHVFYSSFAIHPPVCAPLILRMRKLFQRGGAENGRKTWAREDQLVCNSRSISEPDRL